jgi:uncharacterized membrane protein
MVPALVLASTTWVAALTVAPFMASRAHLSPPLYACVVALYGAGAAICHQLPARSFRLWGAQMPVCARCTGIYVGAALAALVAAALSDARGEHPRGSVARTLLLVAALPSLATLVFEWTTGQAPSNLTRALAGLPLGAAVGWLLVGPGYEVN